MFNQPPRTPEQALSWMMMAAYGYYVEDDPLVDDATYDEWYHYIKECAATLDHPHAHLINLEGGGSSGAIMLTDWPAQVAGAVAHYRREVMKEAPPHNSPSLGFTALLIHPP